ncbi:MAG: hypothetical protein JZU60_04580, partial [Ilumatobacteraceae bacterium]|nr:hypothetical protein [Ilumatobacteraceae bacterium]
NAGTAKLTLSNDVDVDLHLAVGGVGYTITASGNAADTIVGSLYADTITGGTGSDAITGGAGNDIITGGAGVDSLDGGDGADTFRFADRAEIVGDATIVGGNLIDTIVITAQVTSALDLGNEA